MERGRREEEAAAREKVAESEEADMTILAEALKLVRNYITLDPVDRDQVGFRRCEGRERQRGRADRLQYLLVLSMSTSQFILLYRYSGPEPFRQTRRA